MGTLVVVEDTIAERKIESAFTEIVEVEGTSLVNLLDTPDQVLSVVELTNDGSMVNEAEVLRVLELGSPQSFVVQVTEAESAQIVIGENYTGTVGNPDQFILRSEFDIDSGNEGDVLIRNGNGSYVPFPFSDLPINGGTF